MNGGEALVATLRAHGVDTAFGIPGESYLAVLEALRAERDRLRFVLTRHESGASFAACAYGRLTGRPGAVFVTRGPGATNASIGIHTARQDSVPLLLFIGQVPTSQRGREAFQEVDYAQMLGPLTKRVLEPGGPQEVAQMTAEAHAIALEGRPGPVAVVLPEDVTEGDAGAVAVPRPAPRAALAPDPEDVDAVVALLEAAQHPVVLAGEQVSFDGANDALGRLAEAYGCGVFGGFRRQGVLASSHPAWLGYFGLALQAYQADIWSEVDLVLALGTRLDLATTLDDTLIRADQTLVQAFPDAEVLAVCGARVGLCADAAPTIEALLDRAPDAPPAGRAAWVAAQHARFEAARTGDPGPPLGAVDMRAVTLAVAERLPQDATIVNDAGNFSTWVHRHYPYADALSQAAPAAGAMGYAVPGAVGAKLACPERTVVAFVGDGGFSMTGQELITAVVEDLPLVVVVCDNAGYGTIAMHQFRRYGADATYAIALDNPDFAAAARAWGAAAWTVETTDAFAPAFDEAVACGRPALIHVKTDLRDLAASGLKLVPPS